MAEPKACKGGKRYCVLCSAKEGSVRLHRIPYGESAEKKSLRRAWLQRIKLVRPDAPITENTRVCIQHFVDQRYAKRTIC